MVFLETRGQDEALAHQQAHASLPLTSLQILLLTRVLALGPHHLLSSFKATMDSADKCAFHQT